MNLHAVLDNNFVLLYESEELFSPLAMIYYHRYSDKNDVLTYIQAHEEEIQAVIGNEYIPFGKGQCPGLNDYADGVDTMAWLSGLSGNI